MKTLWLSVLFCVLTLSALTQSMLSGNWQGILIRDGGTIQQATIIYLTIPTSDKEFMGKTREEIYDTELFAVKKLKGTTNGKNLNFQQSFIEKKKTSSKTTWCMLSATMSYNDSTGYIEGKYTSTDCRNNRGKIILYRSNVAFPEGDKSTPSQAWFKTFVSDYSKGYFAPEIRNRERDNFKFVPIYFDYDLDEIKPEYHDFLIRLVRVVNGHSDLRIKVTGHTDADGSDEYNLDLSKRRAEAIIEFFTSHGLSKDRLEIDFKGESLPVDNNSTPEGKQNNRRVDFSFI
ncbi:MAG: OmpA family protein [Cryomorphaceae bacterium]|jgi:OOP family OmpA-OmpF porin|nr:OmpA family protein [Cryomorphaceae bacterium]